MGDVTTMTSIEAASAWLIALVSGSLTTLLLTIGIALAAFAMFSGRLSFRGAARFVLGGFILVGSAEIARALLHSAPHEEMSIATLPPPAPARDLPPPPPQEPSRSGNPFDPYSGRGYAN